MDIFGRYECVSEKKIASSQCFIFHDSTYSVIIAIRSDVTGSDNTTILLLIIILLPSPPLLLCCHLSPLLLPILPPPTLI
jgi:hypothetical protein